jgi:REP element-mobilizing transposase RayT
MFEPEGVYHIYNRANGAEDLFREEKNYPYFLEKYFSYISPVAETFAWCLMPNHFHLMIKIRTIEEVAANLKRDPTGFENLSGLVSQQFSNLFNGYTKAINKVYERHGSLFQRPFKHKKVVGDAYFTQLVLYIHNNPVKHGFVRRMQDWPHSSYHQYIGTPTLAGLGNLSGLVNTNVVIDWFGSPEQFKKAHESVGALRSVFE